MQAVCSTSVTGIKGVSVARSSGQLHHLHARLARLAPVKPAPTVPCVVNELLKICLLATLQAEPHGPAQLVSTVDVLFVLTGLCVKALRSRSHLFAVVQLALCARPRSARRQ